MSVPTSLPDTVRIGLYEEFPSSDRLDKLRHVDFPVSLAKAASSRAQFLQLRGTVRREYPQVRDVLFWPLLTPDEGCYPGAWSDATAVQRAAREADGLPVLWDLELPRNPARPSLRDWWRNRTSLDASPSRRSACRTERSGGYVYTGQRLCRAASISSAAFPCGGPRK